MLIIGGNLLVDPEQIDSFLEQLRALGVLATNAGALFFAAALEARSDGRVLVLERWPDKATLDAFLTRAEVRLFFSVWAPQIRNELLMFDADKPRGSQAQ